ncbi:MAG TPA: serine/threonine-protein kinase [Polyangiaceae bacterium]|nr:serine/threonine-protein kinase [Polyangiaceae bacterium]
MTAGVVGESLLPRRFGAYVLVDKIGEGGMAEIFLSHGSLGTGAHKRLVIKLILPLLAQNDAFCQLLINEAKLSAQLSHGNIVQVFDLGRQGDMLYIAMEYIEGVDLRQLLRECAKKKVSLPLEYAVFMVIQALEGLAYAHDKCDDAGQPLSIVHRDVSPSNILLSLEGEVKLCDFGIARALGVSSAIPDDAIQGKAGYMSPEAANGNAVDRRSDIFSVGIVLWELLSGRRLYRGEKGKSPPLALAQKAEIPALDLSNVPGGADLERIVSRALAKEPEQRYSSAAQMRDELEGYLEAHDLIASPLRFGRWLREYGAPEVIEHRRAAEQAVLASPLPLDDLPEAGGELASENTDHSHITSASSTKTRAESEARAPAPEEAASAAISSTTAGQQPSRRGVSLMVFLIVVAVAFALGVLLRLR